MTVGQFKGAPVRWALLGVAVALAVEVTALGAESLGHWLARVRVPSAEEVSVITALSTLSLAAATFLVVLQNRGTRVSQLRPHLTMVITPRPLVELDRALAESRGQTVGLGNFGPGVACEVRLTYWSVDHAQWLAKGKPEDLATLEALKRTHAFARWIDNFGVGRENRCVIYADDTTPTISRLAAALHDPGMIRLLIESNDLEGRRMASWLAYVVDEAFPHPGPPRASQWRLLQWVSTEERGPV